jgi:hypothetical protein
VSAAIGNYPPNRIVQGILGLLLQKACAVFVAVSCMSGAVRLPCIEISAGEHWLQAISQSADAVLHAIFPANTEA